MNKLLVLITVLGVASAANAMWPEMKISVNGVIDPPDTEIMLIPSDTVEIGIWGNGQTPSPVDLWLILEPYAPAQGATMSGGGLVGSAWNTSLSVFDLHTDDLYTNWLRNFNDYPEYGYNTDQAYFIRGVYNEIPSPNYTGTIVDNIILECENPVDVKLTLVDISQPYDEDNEVWLPPLFIVYDTQVIHQIPEPMTITLLGLGGLMLLRRRR